MIRYIKGTIYHQMDGSIIVENSSGMGFHIMISAGSSFYKLVDGEEVKVHTSMIVNGKWYWSKGCYVYNERP